VKKTSAPVETVANDQRTAWSKWLKWIGGALLLFAFGFQMNQLREKELADKSVQAAELEGRCNIRALEYENLYITTRIGGVDKPYFLQMSAQEYYHGRAAMMLASPGNRANIEVKLSELEQAANNVHDLASLGQYFATHNQIESESYKTEVEGLVEPSHNAEHLGVLYIFIYAFGTTLALIGQALD
jgi:hypothetical protein